MFVYWVEMKERRRLRKETRKISDRTNLCLFLRAYCGMPAGLEAFRVAERVLGEMESKGELKRE